ncbi:hypothetical protein SAMN04487895_104198 [Paenibacillus sophorae]|uniref:Uncharacterized protein n=1 Tax=Paenibacillus sophorae TaxID=1333845 RepID=A0A1H8L6E2_9BACL|nr:hypothetical protein [Paenibacillus sophorae]QWU17414.1 hypothetical protein KP014_09805 [Paenibacillus sophorae]SEO00649.1 hypothetical protein SAMN04487895_104198 [Paenibacillus sophorae]
MLSDNARKLLRIMVAYRHHFGYMPPMWQLQRRSSRRPEQIRAALQELVDERYIKWQPGALPETVVILEAWEREETGPSRRRRRR